MAGDQRERRVAVIGAGMSGLTTAKALLEEGLEPVVFERSAQIGGVWNYHEELADGGGPAYRSLRTNTSKLSMGFSDFPFPEAVPDFPLRADVLAYLHTYCDYAAARPYLRLRTRVEAATPVESGQWQVRAQSPDGATTERFDGLVVCAGREQSPFMPAYPGADTFQGALTHSAAYSVPESYAEQNVLVVGIGPSAADIAVELSRVARRVIISTTQGAWFIPRTLGGRPYDHQLTRLSLLAPYPLRARVFRALIEREYRWMGVHGRLRDRGLPEPAFDLWRARMTVSTDIVPAIAAGTIQVKPRVARLDARSVVFADGSAEQVDAVICASGYTVSYPFLAPSVVTVENNAVDLYRHVFHPSVPHLAFIGLCMVAGTQFPVAELQARWVARVLAGRAALPSTTQMRAEIRARKAGLSQLSPYPMRVQLLEYMDEIAQQIGARPRITRHLPLAAPLLFGPPAPAQYRLDGPGTWSGAPDVLAKCLVR